MYNLRRIDMNLLTVLEALYIERNLTKAAERVGLSQPAMSNALARLRAALDDELFIRQGRKMQPTPRARQVARATQQAFDIIRKNLSGPAEFDTTIPHSFSLCGSEHCELVIMPLLMAQLGQTAANVKVNTVRGRGDYLARLKSGEADLVIDYQVPNDAELSTAELTVDKLVCLMRRDHPFKKESLSLQDYASLKHVVPEPVVNRFFLENFLRSKGVSREIVARTVNVFAMPTICENSDMVCTISELLADVVASEDRFRRYPAPLPDPSFPLFMVWHQSRDTDPGHTWLRDLVKDTCQGFTNKTSEIVNYKPE